MHPTLRGLGLEKATRHLLFCPGPDCCASAEGESSWQYLKQRLKDLGIPAFRTKAGCLRVCERGPVMVVYPEGIWYERMTVERLERVLTEHLRDGKPVVDWVIARHTLPTDPPAP